MLLEISAGVNSVFPEAEMGIPSAFFRAAAPAQCLTMALTLSYPQPSAISAAPTEVWNPSI